MDKEKQKIELDRCLNGCILEGIKISGKHYFYINYWKIGDDPPEYRERNEHFFRYNGRLNGMIFKK